MLSLKHITFFIFNKYDTYNKITVFSNDHVDDSVRPPAPNETKELKSWYVPTRRALLCAALAHAHARCEADCLGARDVGAFLWAL